MDGLVQSGVQCSSNNARKLRELTFDHMTIVGNKTGCKGTQIIPRKQPIVQGKLPGVGVVFTPLDAQLKSGSQL